MAFSPGGHDLAGIVVVSPLPCSGVMMDGCSKCPLVIPDRRYRLPEGIILSPLRSEDIRRASKQLIEATIYSKHPSRTLCK